MIKEVYSEKETRDFAYEMAQKAEVGQVYCLDGDLGVGKTVFTKGFTIVNEYHSGRIPFYHFDVYRIGDEDEMFDIGFDEYVDGDGVCLIEWAELIKGIIPENAVSIKITKDLSKGLDYRKIEVEE